MEPKNDPNAPVPSPRALLVADTPRLDKEVRAVGWDVTVVKTAFDAQDALIKETVHALVVDAHLVDASGFHVVTRARWTAPGIPALILARSVFDELRAERVGAEHADAREVEKGAVPAFLQRCLASADGVLQEIHAFSNRHRLKQPLRDLLVVAVRESSLRKTLAHRLRRNENTVKSQVTLILRRTGYMTLENVAEAIRTKEWRRRR